MARSLAGLLAWATIVMAVPSPITPDPNGDKNVGNGQGLQFITGGCLSTADCSQAVVQSCCAFIAGGASTGICSGAAVGNVNGKAGCGFGDGSSSTDTASTAAASTAAASTAATAATSNTSGSTSSDQCTVDTSLAGSQSVGTGSGTQFITGQCFSAADCQSGCCVAQASGPALCKAQIVTEEAGLTCDFSCSASSANNKAAAADSTTNTTTTTKGTDTDSDSDTCPADDETDSPSSSSSSYNSSNNASSGSGSSGTCPAIDTSLPGSQNVGTGSGTQFITGQCFTSADCASGCCVAQSSGISLCKAELVTAEAGLSCDSSCTGGSAASSSTTSSATSSTSSDTSGSSTGSDSTTTASSGSGMCAVDNSLPGAANVGTGSGTQFITGQCFSSADCQSACCVAQSSGVALCKAQLVTAEAGLSCDFSC